MAETDTTRLMWRRMSEPAALAVRAQTVRSAGRDRGGTVQRGFTGESDGSDPSRPRCPL
jgi:hypothetical protein